MTGGHHGEQGPSAGPWDPDEQVGDVYEVEVTEDGQIEHAERLRDQPQIWVGSWLDYNNDRLHGQWIDAAQDEVELQGDIAEMLASSLTSQETGEPAEDWGIFDHDNFGPLRIEEQESLSWISAVARGIAEHGLAFAAYADVVEDEAALAGFENSYFGHYESVDAYAEQLIEDLGYVRLLDEHLPEGIRRYIDIDVACLARDIQLGGDIHTIPADGGGVWLFQGG